MNFTDLLNWISGTRKPIVPAPTAASGEKRRYQRIGVSESTAYLGKEGPFIISNLSYGGIRINLQGHPLLKTLKKDEEIQADLKILNIQFTVTLKICNILGTDLGCSFPGLTSAHSRILSDFLKPRILGASLQEITATGMQNRDPGLRLRCFQGDEDTRIFLWQTMDGQIVKEEYYFFDYVITWDQEKHLLQTGKFKPGADRGGVSRIDQSTVAFFNVPSYRALKIGKQILEVSHLPPEAKDQLLSNIMREERRLYNRYVLKDSDQCVRFYLDGNDERFLNVANLSLKGIALFLPEDTNLKELLQPKTLLGELEISGVRVQARVRVVYGNQQLIGGALEVNDPQINEALAAFLAPRLLAQSLEEFSTPLDEIPHAPPGARSCLFVGLHNTHLLSLVAPGETLITGRIAFMDNVLMFEHGKLQGYICPRGIIFPRDWDLPLGSVEPMPTVNPDLKILVEQIIQLAKLPDEVGNAWKKALISSKDGVDTRNASG